MWVQHELEVAKKDCEDMIKVMQEWERKVSAYAAQEKQWDRETQAARDEVRLYLVFVGALDVLRTVTVACAKRTGTGASVEHWRHEPDRAISPE